ncbi:uncharacterized protein LOC126807879 [Patella vulgata]|uniref:uncharacterized protein LOC126807879 n=1 Tax=Patella vulgata TaxID=6465 RepID=UPI0024A94398|nr:uncharacterized protein LOC126807879 [Patella vulgata]
MAQGFETARSLRLLAPELIDSTFTDLPIGQILLLKDALQQVPGYAFRNGSGDMQSTTRTGNSNTERGESLADTNTDVERASSQTTNLSINDLCSILQQAADSENTGNVAGTTTTTTSPGGQQIANPAVAELVSELDREIGVWESNALAASTKRSYRSQLKCYFDFCSLINCVPIPASSTTLLRYVAFLARSKTFSSIKQYLNVLRLLHRQLSLPDPSVDSWRLRSMLLGIKRVKGARAAFKLPLTLEHLDAIRQELDMSDVRDSQMWAAILTGFFGLLRISNFTTPTGKSRHAECKSIQRGDCRVIANGIVLTVRSSKTIQFRGRAHELVLPLLEGRVVCPATAVAKFFLAAGDLADDIPLFSYLDATNTVFLTPDSFRQRLRFLLSRIGLSVTDFNSHSLRRGGASWLISAGVSLPVVRAIGDWKSDCVFKYLQPDHVGTLRILQSLTYTT